MKIIQFGIPRSGTVIIWQILKDIFKNDQIIKTHIYDKGITKNQKIVATIRDFRDILISRFVIKQTGFLNINDMHPININERKNKSFNDFISLENISEQDIINICNEILKDEKYMDEYLKLGDNILWLRYESYFNNFDYIFDKLEIFFDIKINSNLRNVIKVNRNIEKNKNISLKMKNFNEYDPNSFLYGNHINFPTPDWKNKLPIKYHSLANELLKSILLKWEYK